MNSDEMKLVLELLHQQQKSSENQNKLMLNRMTEVLTTVKDVDKKVGIQNGRVTKLEVEFNNTSKVFSDHIEDVDKRFDKIEPSNKALAILRYVLANPLKSIAGFLIFLALTEIGVIFFISRKLFWQLIDKFI